MTYFKRGEPEPEEQRAPLFTEPVLDDPAAEDIPEDWDAEDLPPEETAWRDVRDPEEREERLQRRDQLRLLWGMSDFLLVILGTAAVLALIALIVSMIVWVRGDVLERFPALQNLGAAGRAVL